MEVNPIKNILIQKDFSEKEQEAFLEIIEYAKMCQKMTNDRETMKSFIDAKVNEVCSNETA